MAARLKAARRRQIETLLRRGEIASQAELARALKAKGLSVTQATLSRDLEELGAFKARGSGGRAIYTLPTEQPASADLLARMMEEFVNAVDASGNLVILRTPPGGAAPVARAIDASVVPGILGTIAGDDTVMIVCGEGVKGATVARRLEGARRKENR